MTTIEKAVAWAIETANDNRHGYSQADRWGPDYDCSSFVISAWENAGVPLREAGASYTGNMRPAMIACGFVDVTGQVGIGTGYGIQAGDVLLNYAAHTCMAIGNGKVANCRTNEGNPQQGDQSGNEIRIQAYWDGAPNRWNCVLRYKGTGAASDEKPEQKPGGETKPAEKPESVDHALRLPMLRTGSKGNAVKLLQASLTLRNFKCGTIDGDFGPLTKSAVLEFQKWAQIEQDGIAGPETMRKILEIDK